jgi:hypothetical protein
MTIRRFIFFIVIILLLAIFRPSGFWNELKRLWEQRETITRILFLMTMVYLLYGIYQLYTEGWLDRWLPN